MIHQNKESNSSVQSVVIAMEQETSKEIAELLISLINKPKISKKLAKKYCKRIVSVFGKIILLIQHKTGKPPQKIDAETLMPALEELIAQATQNHEKLNQLVKKPDAFTNFGFLWLGLPKNLQNDQQGYFLVTLISQLSRYELKIKEKSSLFELFKTTSEELKSILEIEEPPPFYLLKEKINELSNYQGFLTTEKDELKTSSTLIKDIFSGAASKVESQLQADFESSNGAYKMEVQNYMKKLSILNELLIGEDLKDAKTTFSELSLKSEPKTKISSAPDVIENYSETREEISLLEPAAYYPTMQTHRYGGNFFTLKPSISHGPEKQSYLDNNSLTHKG